MNPSSEYLFSLFSRQISNLNFLFNCKCHEEDSKVYISKKVHRRAFGTGADDDFVREIAATVRENYKEMGECCAALERMIDALSCELAKPVVPCGEQRRALETCYSAHTHQPLNCYHLVTEFMQCARDYALTAHS